METRRSVVLHVADRAEALGYEGFFLAEGWGHDAGVLLAEVATRTHRITLGTGILNIWGCTTWTSPHPSSGSAWRRGRCAGCWTVSVSSLRSSEPTGP